MNTESLGYDADVNDPAQYCRHGTFIGSWWGPDYMCGWCETGTEPPTPYQQQVQAHRRKVRQAKEQLASFQAVVDAFNNTPTLHFGQAAHALANMAENSYWAAARWYIGRQGVFQ